VKWSDKRKKSINCDSPKGFSEKAHCASKKKMAGGGLAKSQQSLKSWGDQKWTPKRVRSNNTSKAGGKSTGKTVRAPAQRNKSKSKTVPKG
jgi:hypothetical protein